ncbi:hypothetical protein CGRA01v4_06798 [Colletotrichum graminicola]|nr:hypothetical protein CGRA01v4_06798 [Colletotrichum graminicola]
MRLAHSLLSEHPIWTRCWECRKQYCTSQWKESSLLGRGSGRSTLDARRPKVAPPPIIPWQNLRNVSRLIRHEVAVLGSIDTR